VSDIKSCLRQFIINNYLHDMKAKVEDSESFLDSGIVDSIGVIELTAFVSKEYGIKIEVAEIVPENFDSLNNLENYIKRKIQPR